MSVGALRIPAILLLSTCALGQEETGESSVPEGLSATDWAGVREAYEAGRHAAHPIEGGYEARNPGQAWQTYFDGQGFLTVPDAGGWTWGLELEHYGFRGRQQEVTSPVRVSAEGGRVAYEWDATLEEWYENDRRGLEHGYTVRRRPVRNEPDEESPLSFTLAVRGELRAQVADSGRGVRFLDEGGSVVLTYTGLSVFDANGRELEARFEALDDGDRLLLSVNERGARYPLVIDPIAQHAYLKASNTDADDWFGVSVAVSGDTVMVGAPTEDSSATGVNGNQNDNSAPSAGAAYVFVRSGTTWSQEAYLKASNTDASDYFGWSVAASGDTVVVGAWSEDSSATGVDGDESDNSVFNAGAAYVFVRSGTIWSQEAYLKASNTEASDLFGDSVAVSGDTVVVGAYSEDSNATGVDGDRSDNSAPEAGAAYVFVRSGTTWSQEAYLKASNTDASDLFGSSVAASFDTVVVGTFREDSSGSGVGGDQSDNSASDAGAAYVFVRSGTSWSQDAYLKASNTDAGDEFGRSVTVSGDTVVVGAPFEDSNSTGVDGDQSDNSAMWAGAAYVFVRSGTIWSQEAYLKASNTDAIDWFGWSVAASGDTVVVGSNGEDSSATGVDGDQSDNSANGAGAAYEFVRSGTSWSQEAYLKASNTDTADVFGVSVAVSGDTVVVGAYREDSSATGVNGNQSDNSAPDAGAAYVFNVGLGTNYCTSTPNSTGLPAFISATGSASVAANDLSLRAQPVPTQQNGVFFYGPVQSQVPFGNGFRCVGAGATGIARLPIENSGPGGVLEHDLDNTLPPTAVTQITSGSTWNFQAWFRDPAAGGAFFNLSDGLSITFGL